MQQSFKPTAKSSLIFIAKVVITLAALYFATRQIDLPETKRAILSADPGYLFLALLTFIGAKLISTLRLRALLFCTGTQIGHWLNIQLFFTGAFFNLFLPSSVGGDGVKAYLINEKLETPIRKSISAVLLDRMSGLVMLMLITLIFLLVLSYTGQLSLSPAFLIIGIGLVLPSLYFGIKLLFKSFLPSFAFITALSLFLQVLHLTCAWLLLKAMGIAELVIEHLSVLALSIIASVVPLSIGGIGVRELVSKLLAGELGLSQEIAVSLAALYSIVIMMTSLIGLPFALKLLFFRKN